MYAVIGEPQTAVIEGHCVIYLSRFQSRLIASACSLHTGQCMWTASTDHPHTFSVPLLEPSAPIRLCVWTRNAMKGLFIQYGSIGYCILPTDGTLLSHTKSEHSLHNGICFQRWLIGMNAAGTQLVEYELPTFHKTRMFRFQTPVRCIARPAKDLLLLMVPGTLSQFSMRTRTWGVKYHIQNEHMDLAEVRIGGRFVLARSSNTVYIWSANGHQLATITTTQLQIQAFALSSIQTTGATLVLLEQTSAGYQLRLTAVQWGGHPLLGDRTLRLSADHRHELIASLLTLTDTLIRVIVLVTCSSIQILHDIEFT